jgi:hypothetical protein
MQQVTGIYPAALGAPSNEISGKAIQARQREGDTGTFNYIEAFGRAIRRTGQIILDLIPHVYDTERSIQIVGEDGKVALQKINQAALSQHDGVTPVTLNDVTIGSYHMIVEMGPSFSTKREEARDGMQTLMQSLGPQAVPLIADLYVKQQDFPLADKIADRLHMMLPPPVLAKEAQENGEPPPPMPGPPPPPPEMQIKMQQAQQEHALDAARLQFEQQRAQAEDQRKLAEAHLNAETARAKIAADNDLQWRKAQLASLTAIEVARIGAKQNSDSAQLSAGLEAALHISDQAHEKQMAAMAADNEPDQSGGFSNGAPPAQ